MTDQYPRYEVTLTNTEDRLIRERRWARVVLRLGALAALVGWLALLAAFVVLVIAGIIAALGS